MRRLEVFALMVRSRPMLSPAGSAVSKAMVSDLITGFRDLGEPDTQVFRAGTTAEGGGVVTAGGAGSPVTARSVARSVRPSDVPTNACLSFISKRCITAATSAIGQSAVRAPQRFGGLRFLAIVRADARVRLV